MHYCTLLLMSYIKHIFIFLILWRWMQVLYWQLFVTDLLFGKEHHSAVNVGLYLMTKMLPHLKTPEEVSRKKCSFYSNTSMLCWLDKWQHVKIIIFSWFLKVLWHFIKHSCLLSLFFFKLKFKYIYPFISQIECLLPANVVKVLVKIIDGKQKKKNPVYESASRFVSYYFISHWK